MYLVFSAEFLAKESPQVGAPNVTITIFCFVEAERLHGITTSLQYS